MRARYLTLAVFAVLCLPGTAFAAKLPPQGVYESCAPDAGGDARCLARLDQIGGAGFRVVLNYAALYRTPAQLVAYARHARAAGLTVIWPVKDRSWWGPGDPRSDKPALAEGCSCATEGQFLRYLVRLLAPEPGTWGWYVGDETSPVYRTQVAKFSRRLHGLDPHHKRLYVAQEDPGTKGRNLRPFASSADVLGADSYPVSTFDPLSTVGKISAIVHRVAQRNRKASAAVLQAFSWAQYPSDNLLNRRGTPRWPTRGEMRSMRDLAVRHGHHGLLLWYSFQDIQRADDPARRWSDLRWAALGR